MGGVLDCTKSDNGQDLRPGRQQKGGGIAREGSAAAEKNEGSTGAYEEGVDTLISATAAQSKEPQAKVTHA